MFSRLRSDLAFMAFALAAVFVVLTSGDHGTAVALPFTVAVN